MRLIGNLVEGSLRPECALAKATLNIELLGSEGGQQKLAAAVVIIESLPFNSVINVSWKGNTYWLETAFSGAESGRRRRRGQREVRGPLRSHDPGRRRRLLDPPGSQQGLQPRGSR